MTISSLEITIRLRDGQYLADARYQPDEAAPALSTLAEGAPTGLQPAGLSAYAGAPDAYGPQLAAQLFADAQLREAWRSVRAIRQPPGATLRLWLRMAAGDPLQRLRWELLSDPLTDRPIALERQVSLVRATTAVRHSELPPLEGPELRASVIVAQPADLEQWGLSEIDIDGELSRAQAALEGIRAEYIGDRPNRRATRAALRQALQAGPHILYLVGHAMAEPRGGELCLLLEHDDGSADLVSGSALAGDLGQVAGGPLRLVVLAARRRAGSGYGEALNPIGLQLAELGLPAILSFQGDVSVATTRQLFPALFSELRRDGRIDRALAVVRQALLPTGSWWQPVLWLGNSDGQLWHNAPAQPPAGPPALAEAQLNTGVLRQLLIASFSDGELRDLCVDLGDVDFESLPGQSKSDRARELVSYMERRGRLADLLARCRQERPNTDWARALQPAPPAEPGPAPRGQFQERSQQLRDQREAGSDWPAQPDPAPIEAPGDRQRRPERPDSLSRADGPASYAVLDALESLLEQEPASPDAAQAVAELIEAPASPLDQRLRAADIAGRFSDLRFPLSMEQWRISLAERNDEFGRPRGYWCFVPGGTYQLGERSAAGDGGPVAVAGFWIARYPITVAQYRRFIEDGGYQTADWWHPQGWAWRRSGEIGPAPWGWGDPRYARPNQPVVGLGWDEAAAFCQWLQAHLSSSLRGYTLRLPSEAEWEVAAARGDDGVWRKYPWGDESPTIDHAIHLSEPQHYRHPGPAPVGCAIRGAAGCGALDMGGNVWELVETSWSQYPLQSNRPPDPDHSDYIVWRGGAWSSTRIDLTCQARDRSRRQSHNLEHGGFRIALVSKSGS